MPQFEDICSTSDSSRTQNWIKTVPTKLNSNNDGARERGIKKHFPKLNTNKTKNYMNEEEEEERGEEKRQHSSAKMVENRKRKSLPMPSHTKNSHSHTIKLLKSGLLFCASLSLTGNYRKANGFITLTRSLWYFNNIKVEIKC